MTRHRSAFLAASASTMIWGVNYSVGKRVLAEIDPLAVACVRACGAGALFTAILLGLEGIRGLAPRRLRRALVPGLLGIFGNQLLFISGLKHTSAAHAAILIALTPVFVLILSALAGQETVTPAKSAGIAVAFIGVALVAAEKGLDVRSEYLKGDVLTLLAVLAFAGFTVSGKPVLLELGPLRTTALTFVTGGLGIVLVTLPATARQDWRGVSGTALLGLGYMVVLATIVSYLLYYYALARIDPSQIAVFTYLQPMVAALVAFVVAGERISGIFVGGGALVLAGVLLTEGSPRRPADLVLLNGTVVTLDSARPEARAIAVRGDTIEAVGSDEEILRRAGPATRRIDLGGRMVLPGLIDAHGHVRGLGERLAGLDLRGVATVEEIARRVRERAAVLPRGEWVTGGGWDQNLWPGRRFPDHRPLTEAAPDRPVFLTRVDGHAAWANLAAMRAAGITRETNDPGGGAIERDARGEPTGLFIDNALDLVREARPEPSRETIKSWIRLALRRCTEAGLTEVHDAGVRPEVVTAYRELADAGELPLRVYLMWDGTGLGAHLSPGAAAETPVEPLLAQPPFTNYRGRLTLRALKLMIDGAMGSRGAAFFQDYADAPGHRGLLVTPPEEIERATELALRSGYQVCTHAIGDRAIHLTLDAYRKALAAVPVRDPRLRVEHAQCLAREDLPLMKTLGVVASMQPSHATSDMPWAEDRVGPERGRGLYAWRWVLDAGVTIAAGSDFPVDPERPLLGLHSAVTRQDPEGRPAGGWHREQAMTLDEALRAYTGGAAYAAFEEDHKGRIAPGFWADLTILSRDLRAIPPAEIDRVSIAGTIVGGTIAFRGF